MFASEKFFCAPFGTLNYYKVKTNDLKLGPVILDYMLLNKLLDIARAFMAGKGFISCHNFIKKIIF